MAPCRDGRDNDCGTRTEYIDRDNPAHLKRIKVLDKQLTEVDAGLCAVLSHLERALPTKEFVKTLATITKNSDFDIAKWWTKHKKEDEKHILAKLRSEYSEDELAVIRKLMGE